MSETLYVLVGVSLGGLVMWVAMYRYAERVRLKGWLRYDAIVRHFGIDRYEAAEYMWAKDRPPRPKGWSFPRGLGQASDGDRHA